jgi:hypothetical protein
MTQRPQHRRTSDFWPKTIMAILVLFALALTWWLIWYAPDPYSVRGKWVTVEKTMERFSAEPYSTRLTFREDNTFTWTNADPRVIGIGSYNEQQRSSLIEEASGTWGIYGELMGPARVIHMHVTSHRHAPGVMAVGRGRFWSPRLQIESYEGNIVFRRAPEQDQ